MNDSKEMNGRGIPEEGSSKILKAVMKETGTKQVELAEALGMKQVSVSGNINRPQIGLSVFVKMLNAMGYTVAVGKKTEDGFEAIWEVKKENE